MSEDGSIPSRSTTIEPVSELVCDLVPAIATDWRTLFGGISLDKAPIDPDVSTTRD